ncbi:MAG TPA: ABC transporter ATP-binding protein [Chloroflexia bacterium]|jgi:branched-chain amino acid transport system ATP-binding protein
MLQVTDLVINYGQIEAVKGVSFRVEEGQIVALVGANGAGKTTIMGALSGLLRPRRGSIKFKGEEISQWASHKIVSAGIAQVPEGRAILARMTVRENLELGSSSGGRRHTSEEDIQRVYARFPVLRERSGGMAGNLSGGEQQMLAIGRALLLRPQLLLLDEPSMGLAPLLVKEIFRIIAELNQEGRTVLLVEQNSHKALQIADYAYVLDRGRIVLEGTGQSLLNNEQVARTYLGGKAL